MIGTISQGTTGGWQNWVTASTNLTSVTGVHDIYLVFTGGNTALFNFNWIEFSESDQQQSTSKNTATLTIIEPATDGNQNRFIVYPNPASKSITIDFKSTGTAKMEIIGYLGETIRSRDIENGTKTVDLSGLPSGLYTIKVYDGLETFTKKIIKK